MMGSLLVSRLQVLGSRNDRLDAHRRAIVRRTASSYRLSSGPATLAPSSLLTAAATAESVDMPSARCWSRSRFLLASGRWQTIRGIVRRNGVRRYAAPSLAPCRIQNHHCCGGVESSVACRVLVPSGHRRDVPAPPVLGGIRNPTRVPPPKETIREFGIASATNRPVLLGRSASLNAAGSELRSCLYCGRIGQMQILCVGNSASSGCC